MGCFSKWDIGGCGCTKGTCCALPCPLPPNDLTVTTGYNGGGTATITYQGNCFWKGCLVTGSGAGIIYTVVQITYNAATGCTLFEFLNNNGTNCGGVFGGSGWYYMDPAGCGSTVAPTLLLHDKSSTCSPLSIVFKDPLGGPTFTISYSGTIDYSACSCPGSPCSLPRADLNASVTLPTSPAYTGNGLLAFTSGAGYCQWAGCVGLSGGTSGNKSIYVTIKATSSCTYVKMDYYTNLTCQAPLLVGNYRLWESSAGCSGIAAGSLGPLYLISSACSPLNLSYSSNSGTPSAGDQLTITL